MLISEIISSDLSDGEINADFRWMEPIFRKWIECNKRYQELHVFNDPSDDTLFFYQERTSVGTLAAAAWMVDKGYAAQDYSATKRTGADRRKKTEGYEDLYIGIDENAIRLEAKFDWINGSKILENGTLRQKIYDILELAKEDADRNEKYQTPLGGMAITNFYATHESGKPLCDIGAIVKKVEEIAKEEWIDASVWFFDKDRMVWDGNDYYFGKALFISSIPNS